MSSSSQPLSRSDPYLTIRPQRTAGILAATAGTLVIASVVGHFFTIVLGREDTYGVFELFNVARELTIPTFFSASLLLCSAFLLAIIARLKRQVDDPYGLHWTVLSIVFLYMACDEAAGIHELWIKPMRDLLGGLGIELGAIGFVVWVFPAVALTFAVGLSYMNFLAHLRRGIRLLVVLAGTIFIGGAIGIEIIEAVYVGTFGWTRNFTQNMIFTLQESAEMAGVILFIFALLKYLETDVGVLEWRLGNGAVAPRAGHLKEPPSIDGSEDEQLPGGREVTIQLGTDGEVPAEDQPGEAHTPDDEQVGVQQVHGNSEAETNGQRKLRRHRRRILFPRRN